MQAQIAVLTHGGISVIAVNQNARHIVEQVVASRQLVNGLRIRRFEHLKVKYVPILPGDVQVTEVGKTVFKKNRGIAVKIEPQHGNVALCAAEFKCRHIDLVRRTAGKQEQQTEQNQNGQ